MSQYAAFWDVPADQVPAKTGAAGLLDLSDIREVLHALSIDLSELFVVDVGCGTGRLAQACDGYVGYDIAPGMVAYAQAHGVNAQLLTPETELVPADIVCCLSVFTHITRRDRDTYLRQFAACSPALLADILPAGRDDFSIQAAYSDPAEFEHDLREHGYTSFETYSRTAHTGYGHRYYHAWQ